MRPIVFTIATIVVIFLVHGCDKETPIPENSNEMLAFIVRGGTTDTTWLEAHGKNFNIGCDILISSTYMEGYDESTHSEIGISLIQNSKCITAPGTFNASGYYYLWKNSQSNQPFQPDYDTDFNSTLQAVSGTVTFLEVSGNYREGNFIIVLYCSPTTASCTYQKDSVIVTGHFSGNTTSNL
jgi:hypothetical protein